MMFLDYRSSLLGLTYSGSDILFSLEFDIDVGIVDVGNMRQ
jgi:hypothetical protein